MSLQYRYISRMIDFFHSRREGDYSVGLKIDKPWIIFLQKNIPLEIFFLGGCCFWIVCFEVMDYHYFKFILITRMIKQQQSINNKFTTIILNIWCCNLSIGRHTIWNTTIEPLFLPLVRIKPENDGFDGASCFVEGVELVVQSFDTKGITFFSKFESQLAGTFHLVT
jgi:hypothetical protein